MYFAALALAVGMAVVPAGKVEPLAYRSGLPVRHTQQEVYERLYVSSVVIENGRYMESGEVIYYKDGISIVLTCAHGIHSSDLEVVRGDGVKLPALPLVVDSKRDLALLLVKGEAGLPLPIAEKEPARWSPGYVIGAPSGHVGAGSSGTINGRVELGDGETLYEIVGAFVLPGSSGGILANEQAELIGVVARVYTSTDVEHKSKAQYAYPALSFAIPLSTIREFLTENAELLDAFGVGKL